MQNCLERANSSERDRIKENYTVFKNMINNERHLKRALEMISKVNSRELKRNRENCRQCERIRMGHMRISWNYKERERKHAEPLRHNSKWRGFDRIKENSRALARSREK